jgi:hypothetical protein
LQFARAPSPAVRFGLFAPGIPTRKTKSRHPPEVRGRFSVPDDRDAVNAPRPFTSESDSGCQWQRLSFIVEAMGRPSFEKI